MTAPGSGPYALHAKVIVLGRKRVFIGSMNPDQRSLHLNAEIGSSSTTLSSRTRPPRTSRTSLNPPTITRCD
ncbi:MAG TPA: phospholipase D-like domain-containing protein [Casimicrobiaceae bacterium]|nr:phospholipase D-like domain-containing protein [Casimicrobiaceae bacterium]